MPAGMFRARRPQMQQPPQQPSYGIEQAGATAARFGAPDAMGLTAFQQALRNSRTAATSSAFDNARSRSRERAQAAGMDYTQPITQSNDAAIENARAQAIGNIPGEVAMQSAPLEFQAANLGLAAGQQRNVMDEQRRKRTGGIASGLAKVGVGIAGGLATPTSRFGRILGGISRGIGLR